jgi:hypothetical protein
VKTVCGFVYKLVNEQGIWRGGTWCRAGGLANSAGTAEVIAHLTWLLDDFYYSFPVGSRLDVIVAANSIVTDDFVTSTIVPFDGPSVADAGGPVLMTIPT